MASMYNMKHRRRGKAIIINNVNFRPTAGLRRRVGSREDSDSMKTCLGKLGYDVVPPMEDQTKDEIIRKLQKVSQEDHSDADSLFVTLMSHGGEEGICATDYNRKHDTGLLTLEDIVDPFRANNCPTLAGKPKIFILNACRGDEIDEGAEAVDSVDSRPIPVPSSRVPITADIFICFSCSEGYSTLRDEFTGSFFIQDLTTVFVDSYNKLHLSEMILRVKELVADRQIKVQGLVEPEMQMPVVVDTLRKLVYFANQPTRRIQSSYENA